MQDVHFLLNEGFFCCFSKKNRYLISCKCCESLFVILYLYIKILCQTGPSDASPYKVSHVTQKEGGLGHAQPPAFASWSCVKQCGSTGW